MWTEAIIPPLYKKGDVNVPDNYRGISLLNVCSKLYSFILNKRLSVWAEENEVLGEVQAGFRRDHSTIDHIFTMFAVIQRHLTRHKKNFMSHSLTSAKPSILFLGQNCGLFLKIEV